MLEWLLSERHEIINIAKDVEKREASYTVGRNVSWYSNYGEQYGDASKKVNWYSPYGQQYGGY